MNNFIQCLVRVYRSRCILLYHILVCFMPVLCFRSAKAKVRGASPTCLRSFHLRFPICSGLYHPWHCLCEVNAIASYGDLQCSMPDRDEGKLSFFFLFFANICAQSFYSSSPMKANKVKSTFASLIKSDDPPDYLGKISISYSHSLGTRIRLSIMRAISKRQHDHDPKSICTVMSFTARPMMR